MTATVPSNGNKDGGGDLSSNDENLSEGRKTSHRFGDCDWLYYVDARASVARFDVSPPQNVVQRIATVPSCFLVVQDILGLVGHRMLYHLVTTALNLPL